MSRFGNLKDKHGVRFSERESEVIEHVIKGKTNLEIADLLGVQEKTVKYHITTIYRIAGCKSRAQFIANYYSTGKFRLPGKQS